jgi:hypothetical protein
MMSSGIPFNRLTRRALCRRLLMSAMGLTFGGTLPALVQGAPEAAKAAAPVKSPAAKRKFETKVLWEFAGCWDHPRMKRVLPVAFKGNLYAVIWLPELKTHLVKVPLTGGEGQVAPLMPGHVTGEDPHRSYRLAADSTGRLHVTGDMHGSAFVKHWLSRKPEDITAFDFACGVGSNRGPQGAEVTYPAFFHGPDGALYHSIRCGKPAMGVAISVLDVPSQTWSIIGARVPKEELENQRKNMAAKADANPLSVWEDNGEGGYFKYMQPHAKLVWDRNKRMHIVCSVLNKNTPTANARHTHTHVLYAYSDDGGKTIHRGDGTEIRWPMRADEGPSQGDIVHAESEGNPPWLSVSGGIRIDEKNRPVVSCLSFKTGRHAKVLENGKWIAIANADAKPAGPKDDSDPDDDEDDDLDDLDDYNLGPIERKSLDREHFRATGEALYVSFPSENKRKKSGYGRIQFVLKRPVTTAPK